MNEANWQNCNISKPNYQDICSSECAVSDPDGVVHVKDSYLTGATTWRRSAIFREIRRFEVASDTAVVEHYATGFLPEGEQEVYDKALTCVQKISAGLCSRLVKVERPEVSHPVIMHRRVAEELGYTE
jgi:hypothetical protein